MPSAEWIREDLPGRDAANLEQTVGGWRLEGHARFRDHDGPVDLRYLVTMDSGWITRSAHIEGSASGARVSLRVEVLTDGRWVVNGDVAEAVAGCIDFDVGFSPATNLITLRRLELEVGQSAEVTVAWIPFPEMELRPLRQIYTRRTATEYDYVSPDHDFSSVLRADESGFVREYPPLWTSR